MKIVAVSVMVALSTNIFPIINDCSKQSQNVWQTLLPTLND